MSNSDENEQMSVEEAVKIARDLEDEINEITNRNTGTFAQRIDEISTRSYLHTYLFLINTALDNLNEILFESDPRNKKESKFVLSEISGFLFIAGKGMQNVRLPGYFQKYEGDAITVSAISFELRNAIKGAVIYGNWQGLYDLMGLRNIMENLHQYIGAINTGIETWGFIRPGSGESGTPRDETDVAMH